MCTQAQKAYICCPSVLFQISDTHRFNNSRFSLLSLLATSSINLQRKHTDTKIISSLPLYHPHHAILLIFKIMSLAVCPFIIFHLSVILIGLSGQHFALFVVVIQVSIAVIVFQITIVCEVLLFEPIQIGVVICSSGDGPPSCGASAG